MIDSIRKAFICRGCEAVYSDSPVSSCDCLSGGGFDEHYIVDAETIHNARRYLALRDSRNYSAGIVDKWGLRMSAMPLTLNERKQLDEAADRLLAKLTPHERKILGL